MLVARQGSRNNLPSAGASNLRVAHALRISGGHERGLFTAEIRGARVASLFSRSHFWRSSWKTNDPGARPLTGEFSPVHSSGRAESYPCWCSILALASTNFCFPSELLHRAGLTTRRAFDVSSVAKTRPGAWRFGFISYFISIALGRPLTATFCDPSLNIFSCSFVELLVASSSSMQA
jgi:hypothetical protein